MNTKKTPFTLSSLEVNSLYYGDCFEVMLGWEDADNCVDLIYLDPPFNSAADYDKIFGTEDGVPAQVRAFTDTWRWDSAAVERVERLKRVVAHPAHRVLIGLEYTLGESGLLAYLSYMAERLTEMRRLLRDTGSIYLHCDPTASHYLKVLMDCIFGGKNFVSEIVWNYGTPSGGRSVGKKPVKVHDILLFYAKNYGKHIYNRQYTPYSERYISNWFRYQDSDGRRYQPRSRKGKIVRQYLDESKGVPLSNVWSDIMQLYVYPSGKENLGYPTQKPLALLERIIGISSHEEGLVLDPFCGCGTTVDAAQRLGRRWIGIDVSPFAVRLIRDVRLKDSSIPIYGIPTDLDGARMLLRKNPFDFEAWLVSCLPGIAPNERNIGDRGIDGRGRSLVKDSDGRSLVVVQVKGGGYTAGALRDFLHVIDSERALAGVFITLMKTTNTKAYAHAERLGTYTIGATQYPRLQFWSAEELFGDEKPNLPPMVDPYTGHPIQPDFFIR